MLTTLKTTVNNAGEIYLHLFGCQSLLDMCLASDDPDQLLALTEEAIALLAQVRDTLLPPDETA